SQLPEAGGVEKPRRTGRLVLRGALLLILLPLAWLWFVWPPPAWYRWSWPRETAFMAMRQRASNPPRQSYQPVPMGKIAPILKRAVMAGEDQRFYEHSGLDFVEFRHALGYRPDSFAWRDPRDRARLRAALQQAWAHR